MGLICWIIGLFFISILFFIEINVKKIIFEDLILMSRIASACIWLGAFYPIIIFFGGFNKNFSSGQVVGTIVKGEAKGEVDFWVFKIVSEKTEINYISTKDSEMAKDLIRNIGNSYKINYTSWAIQPNFYSSKELISFKKIECVNPESNF